MKSILTAFIIGLVVSGYLGWEISYRQGAVDATAGVIRCVQVSSYGNPQVWRCK